MRRFSSFAAYGALSSRAVPAILLVVSLAMCRPAHGADELAVIRAAVRRRLSLLQTFDVKLRTWTDTEYTVLVDETETVSDEQSRIHWVTDRGKSFFEISSDRSGGRSSLFYDGKRTIRQVSDPADPKQLIWVYVQQRPPEAELFGAAVLPDLLGVMLTSITGDLKTLVSDKETQLDPNWTVEDANFDIAVRCPAKEQWVRQMHIGFDKERDWAPAFLHCEEVNGQIATWSVEEWMTVVSGHTGDELSVPKRGRYVLRGVVKGKHYRFAQVAEVDQFELPARISAERFVTELPFGTEVWVESKVPGRPPEQHIVGGAAAVAAQAAEASRKVEAAMAELRKTGMKFSGKPRQKSSRWFFLLIGMTFLAAGFLLYRWRSA